MRLAQQSQRGSLYPLTLLTAGRKMSVTISMDEASFPAEEYGKVAVGQALLLRGQVNNAFNTSMEVGVLVTSEAPLPSHFSRHPKRIAHPHLMRCIQALGTGATATVCLAFFIFVAIDESGGKESVEPGASSRGSLQLDFSQAYS